MRNVIKAYDTSALLDLNDNLVIDSTCYISTLVINELENIKVSFNKDSDIKARARQVIRTLKQSQFMTNTTSIKRIGKFSKKFLTRLPNNNDSKIPVVNWRGSANIVFSNWLNYYVYQVTPYNL